ncbi:helix-turn-helix domain-containing protein [Glutamicibacter protophormiae]|uniref:helix-turn-helix domain-containing protein n=1 Tax=Glutamicibacter protophormiae TaxID=37930 RepID=UPI003BAEA887
MIPMTLMPQMPHSADKKVRESADALAIALRANFDGAALVEAVRELSSRADIVQLPVDAQGIWEAGLRGEKLDAAQASARNVVARAQFLDSTLSARDTAELLDLDQSTVRHYSSSGALHSFVHKGRLRFPRWQFVGSEVLPGLSEVLADLSDGVHPQVVEGFFTSENADLVVETRQCTPAQWLAEGRDPLPVARQIASLGIII